MKKLGVPRTAKMLERKISTRNLARDDNAMLANHELKQAKRDIERLEAELESAKEKLSDMRHRMSAAFGAMEMAEKLTGVFAKHGYKDVSGAGHYFVHQKEY